MPRFKLAEFAQLAEIIAAIAVVVSLIYVGKEAQNNTAAIRGAAMQVAATSDSATLMVIATNAELSEIVRLGDQDPSHLWSSTDLVGS